MNWFGSKGWIGNTWLNKRWRFFVSKLIFKIPHLVHQKTKTRKTEKESLNWFGSEGCVDRIPSVTGAAPIQLCHWPHHKELKLILEILTSLYFVFGVWFTNNWIKTNLLDFMIALPHIVLWFRGTYLFILFLIILTSKF